MNKQKNNRNQKHDGRLTRMIIEFADRIFIKTTQIDTQHIMKSEERNGKLKNEQNEN